MRTFLPVAAAALPLLAAACSAAPSPAAPSAAAPAASPTASPLNGVQLKHLLAPASWFPPGFKADPGGSVHTGASDFAAPPPAHLPCRRLGATGWIDMSGVTAVSFAQDDYIDASAGQYAQEIDVYHATSAQDAMAGLRALRSTCRSYRDPQTGGTVTVTFRKGPQLGDDALAISLTNPRWAGGTTLEAVRVGTAVITVYYSSATGSGKAQATKLAAQLVGNVQHQG